MKKTLLEIINNHLNYEGKPTVKELNDSQDLINDLGFDSIDLASITVVIENEYGVDIFEEKIIRTIGEIKKILNE